MEDVDKKRLSQMSPEELREVMRECQRKGQTAFDEDRINELLVLRSRYFLAASYLLNPADFLPGTTYFVDGEEGLFTLSHVDGIIAHGSLSGSPFPVAFPLAMLTQNPD